MILRFYLSLFWNLDLLAEGGRHVGFKGFFTSLQTVNSVARHHCFSINLRPFEQSWGQKKHSFRINNMFQREIFLP